MFDLTDDDLAGEDVQKAVPEGEEGTEIDASLDESEQALDEGLDEEPTDPDEESEEEAPEEEKGDEEEGEGDDEEFDESESYQMLMQDLYDNGIVDIDGEHEYEATPEAFQELISTNIEKARNGAIDEYIESLDPAARELFNTLQEGKTVNDFLESGYVEEVDYNEVNTHDQYGEPMEDNLMNLVIDQMLEQDYSQSEAEERALDIKEAGLLEKEGSRALSWLVRNQEANRESKIEQGRQSRLEAKETAEREESEFKETVMSTREVAGFKLTESEASELYSYMKEPVGPNGESKFELEATPDKALLYPLMAMKGFNLESLSKGEKTKASLRLRNRLSRSTDSKASSKGSSMNGSRRGKSKSESLDLDIFDKIVK